MSDLRKKVASLAKEHPEFRSVLIPLLRKTAMEFTKTEWETYHKEHPGAKITDHKIVESKKEDGKQEAPKKPKKDKYEPDWGPIPKTRKEFYAALAEMDTSYKSYGSPSLHDLSDDGRKARQGIIDLQEKVALGVIEPGDAGQQFRALQKTLEYAWNETNNPRTGPRALTRKKSQKG